MEYDRRDILRGRIQQAYHFAVDPKNDLKLRMDSLYLCGEDIQELIDLDYPAEELKQQSIH